MMHSATLLLLTGSPTYLALPALTIDGQFFRMRGERATIIEASDFSLFKRFLDGEYMWPIIEQRHAVGFNMLRVWLLNRSVVVHGGIHPDDYPHYYDQLAAFVDAVGMNVELTVFTSTQGLMPDPTDQQTHLEKVANAVRGKPNVLLELVNESDQYDNAPSEALVRPQGVLISRGSNGAGAIPPHHDSPWDYECFHTNDLSEWQRKVGHNAMEKVANGSGKPCLSNENTRFVDNDASLAHAYDAAAGAALLCGGACYHSQAGKMSMLWEGVELECAKQWVAGAKSVPLEFQAGQYHHRSDLEDPTVIRVYDRQLPDGRAHVVKNRP